MQQLRRITQVGLVKSTGGFEVPIVGFKRRDDRDPHDHTAMLTIRLPIGSDADIVVARQQGRALAIAMKFSATDSAFIATTISELARALLSRTVRGEIWLHKVHEDERSGVVIVARDPVASDRAPSSRQGHDFTLPDIYRLVDEFDIASEAGGDHHPGDEVAPASVTVGEAACSIECSSLTITRWCGKGSAS